MKKLINLLFALVLTTVVGCGGWSYVKDSKSEKIDSHVSFTVPAGWMKIKFGDTVQMTRDATALQLIRVSTYTKEKAFEKIKKEFPKNALPFELAELFLAEYKANSEGFNIEVVENSPTSIAGLDGFRLHLKTKNPNGVAYQMIVTGFATENAFYTASYDAPSIRYFDLDKNTYETLVKSIINRT